MTNSVLSVPQESLSAWLDRIIGTFTVVEALLAVMVLAIAFVAPGLGRSFFEKIERGAAPLAHNRFGQIVAVGVFALVARAAFLPWVGPSTPAHHDEHSLLLQAQTYLVGRLANPTPAFWEHFESIHINLIPAYASMYFPGRGLPLAAGLLIGGDAWIGIWLVFVLMSMAAVWMLQGWVSRPLALLGGVLVVLRLGVFSYWVNSYWSGAFTALGGMLVLGAVPRILQRPEWKSGLAMAVGAFILLITRPVEGAFLCVPIGIFTLVAMLREKNYAFGSMAVRVALPVVAFCAVGGGALLVHNKATTGDPLTTAYALNRQTYATTPAFLTASSIDGERRGPAYFRAFYDWEEIPHARRTQPTQLVRGMVAKLYFAWNLYIGFILGAAFLAGLYAVRRQGILSGTLALFFTGYFFQTWNFPHYTAPVYSVVLIVLVKGFGWLRTWRPRGRETGLFLTRALPAASLLLLIVPASSVIAGWPVIESEQSRLPCCAIRQSTTRTRVSAQLNAAPGRDLVMVTSDASHPTHDPTVYNEPDIDMSNIVWAYRLSPEKDARLRAHFADRRAWRLDWRPDESYVLRPLPPARPAAADVGG